LTDRLKEGGFSGHFDNLISGVKNLLPSRKDLTLTKVVESLMEPSAGTNDTDDYLYLDPKTARSSAGANKQQRQRHAFQEAIVFVVGGGNYIEYQNLQEYAQVSLVYRIVKNVGLLSNLCFGFIIATNREEEDYVWIY